MSGNNDLKAEIKLLDSEAQNLKNELEKNVRINRATQDLIFSKQVANRNL